MGDTVGPEELGMRFLTLSHRVRRVVDDRMADGGLSLARTKLLQVLAEQGPTRQSSLALQLGFAARTVTEAVDGLERDGLVERSPDPTDRRAKLVNITDAGNTAFIAASRAGGQVLRDIFGVLAGDERETLAGLLELIDRAT
ncbi:MULTISPECIES: MarR family winged helix-turn-helix transcriptional regulator [Streptomyces]|uniref:MarR family winged helix-turn-helix transcriptional regulator n=1 Tax=Streptomyces TaxID=1883 RepID=UPI002E2D420F|nr:MarR family transcriptional regulator [Streptomyces sp. NBC_00271]